jgi:hypothetical protein
MIKPMVCCLLSEWSGMIIIINIKVPVLTVTLIPAGDNNEVDIIEGETHTFKCTTDSSRLSAWIQWYNYYYLHYSTSENSDNHSSW